MGESTRRHAAAPPAAGSGWRRTRESAGTLQHLQRPMRAARSGSRLLGETSAVGGLCPFFTSATVPSPPRVEKQQPSRTVNGWPPPGEGDDCCAGGMPRLCWAGEGAHEARLPCQARWEDRDGVPSQLWAVGRGCRRRPRLLRPLWPVDRACWWEGRARRPGLSPAPRPPSDAGSRRPPALPMLQGHEVSRWRHMPAACIAPIKPCSIAPPPQ